MTAEVKPSDVESLTNEVAELRKAVAQMKVPTQANASLTDSLMEIKTTIDKFDELVKVMQSQIETLKTRGLKYEEEDPERFELDNHEATTTSSTTQQQRPQGTQTGQSQNAGNQPTNPHKPAPLQGNRRRQLLSKKPQSLKEIFQSEPIEDICFNNWRKRTLILIGEDQFAERALQRINSHNVHSIPVISKGSIVGCVDILNIISSLIHAIETGTNQTMQQNIRREFMGRPVSTLITKSFVISSSASILSACEQMIKHGESRFVVARRKIEGDVTELKNETDVVGIFTLSDILKFLVQNSMMMKETPLFNRSLRDLGLGKNPPKCFSAKSNVSDAFKEINRLCCNGLAIVDDGGLLVGNLSASDLKGVTRRNCAILNSSVENFLSRDLKRPWWNRPICIDLNDTLYHTVQQFVSLNVHRMYVVENGKPVGEITHHDVLDQLWKSFH